MKTAPRFAVLAKALVRPALSFCAANLIVAMLAAQCIDVTQVPNQTISSGTVCYSNNDTLTASGVIVNGSASVTFFAGHTIHLTPGFRATAGTAGTTFHAWVDMTPSAISASPASGSGTTQQFTWTASSPGGYSRLTEIYALFAGSLSGQNACYLRYHRPSNLLYLADNAGTTWLGGIAPQTTGTVSNSQCSIDASRSSVSGSGSQLTLNVQVTFQPSYAGTQNNYLIAFDEAGLYSGWQQVGTWTIPGPPAPDFTLTASPDTYQIVTGVLSTATYNLAVTPLDGFNSPVSFSVTPFYGCGYATVNPAQVSGPPWTATLTMSCNQPVANTYWTTVQAWGGGKSHQLTLYLTVTQNPQYLLTTWVNPPGGGTISPAAGWYNPGAQVLVTAAAAAGYQFMGFSGALSGAVNPQYLTMNATKAVTANFTQTGTSYSLTTTVSPSGGGTVSPSCPGGCPYSSGSQVAITATPASGYQFNGFTGTVNSSSNPLTVTMNSAITETANFAPVAAQYQLTTSVSPSGGGTISPSCGGGCLYNSGHVVTVTAAPSPGYVFSGFSGSLSGTANPQNLTMTGPKSVTASFTGAAPDFTLNLPAAVTVEAGFQSSFLLNIVPQGGFSSPVTWTVTPSAPGVSAVWAPNSQPASSPTTATATLTAQPSVSRGAYQVTVTANGGGVQHSATIPMTVSWPLRAQSETNTGPINFQQYNYSQGLGQYPLLQTTCGASSNMRACFQQIMAAYQAQNISGVRFMFDLAEALSPDNSINPAWVSGAQAFFKDLQDHGLYRINPNIREWVSDSQYAPPSGGFQPRSETCLPDDLASYTNYYKAPNITQMRFSRTAPFGEVYICKNWDKDNPNLCKEYDWDIDGNGLPGGQAYSCAMANTYFVGWSRIFDIVDALLQAARDNALTVQEFDVINEMQLSSYAVRGRLIVDNTNNDYDVLGEVGTGLRSLRQSMQAHGFDPRRVTYSVSSGNSQEPLGECPAGKQPYFGDSGRLVELSMLTAAIGASGPFGSMNLNHDLVYPGLPPPTLPYSGSGLACEGSDLGAAYLHISHSQPAVIDVHTAPCVTIKVTNDNTTNETNGWGECDPNQWNSVYGEARQMGNDMAAFLNSFNNGWRGYDANLANALAILGETHGRLTPAIPGSPYTACRMSTDPAKIVLYNNYWAVSAGQDTYSGFINSGLASWAPSNGLPASIIFRPWEYLLQNDDPQANACNTITTNPPYNPAQ
jgi:hypothetical protein